MNMKKLFRAHDAVDVPAPSGVFPNPYTTIDRRPLHSSLSLHTLADAWFVDRFGAPFRSKALFCTGDFYASLEFCREDRLPISIKPAGNFKLCFSERCKDMYRHFQAMPGFPYEKTQVWAELDSLNYQMIENGPWDAAAASGCEIMLLAPAFEYHRESIE
jgi:hypothetical protein